MRSSRTSLVRRGVDDHVVTSSAGASGEEQALEDAFQSSPVRLVRPDVSSFTDDFLMERGDASATIGRLGASGIDVTAPGMDLHVELVALVVLRARAARERSGI